jgi:hypothetical protein
MSSPPVSFSLDSGFLSMAQITLVAVVAAPPFLLFLPQALSLQDKGGGAVAPNRGTRVDAINASRLISMEHLKAVDVAKDAKG